MQKTTIILPSHGAAMEGGSQSAFSLGKVFACKICLRQDHVKGSPGQEKVVMVRRGPVLPQGEQFCNVPPEWSRQVPETQKLGRVLAPSLILLKKQTNKPPPYLKSLVIFAGTNTCYTELWLQEQRGPLWKLQPPAILTQHRAHFQPPVPGQLQDNETCVLHRLNVNGEWTLSSTEHQNKSWERLKHWAKYSMSNIVSSKPPPT